LAIIAGVCVAVSGVYCCQSGQRWHRRHGLRASYSGRVWQVRKMADALHWHRSRSWPHNNCTLRLDWQEPTAIQTSTRGQCTDYRLYQIKSNQIYLTQAARPIYR